MAVVAVPVEGCVRQHLMQASLWAFSHSIPAAEFGLGHWAVQLGLESAAGRASRQAALVKAGGVRSWPLLFLACLPPQLPQRRKGSEGQAPSDAGCPPDFLLGDRRDRTPLIQPKHLLGTMAFRAGPPLGSGHAGRKLAKRVV